MLASVFQEVDGATKVSIKDLSGAGNTVNSGQNRWICCSVDNPIDLWHLLHVAGEADIGMKNFNAERFQHFTIQVAAGARKKLSNPQIFKPD